MVVVLSDGTRMGAGGKGQKFNFGTFQTDEFERLTELVDV